MLGSRYELGPRIGSGGMADVFRGTDVRLGRDVAVKVLRADLARDPSFQARFRREAQAAASLNASAIVPVFDTGTDDSGVPYIVMEFVDGRTLREVLTEEGRLLPQRALEVTADVCAALEAAHAAGIVHRDIKPGNVMLTRAGDVKVMDFGIARAAADSSAMTQTAAVIGTAAYLSPEQARGEHVDARSDLYSTGCLLYELITGGPPFTGDSPVAVAYQHVREDPTPPSAYDETLSTEVDAVVLKAMAKNPANRYQSAGEMREDLLRAAAGEPVHATPVLEAVPVLAPAAVSAVTYDQRDRSTARGVAYGLFGLVLVGIVVGIALLVRGLLGTDSGLVPAPELIGLSQREAVAAIDAAGLTVGDITERFDEEPFGTVLEQSPAGDILLRSGGSVSLVISKGVEMTIVPVEVVGLSREEAEVLLTERKLVVGSVVERDGNVPAGTVLGISPQPGSQVPASSEVTLTVASGNIQVPDVRRKTVQEAAELLQRAGFSVGITPRADPGPPDIVLDQSPVNTLAPRGSTVVIVVSQPPPSPAPSPSAEPSGEPTSGPSPGPSASPEPSPSPTP
ncbi:MAG: Stk1 family PASTA domain-containing Ser/Thr kinase [Frankiales bacterium]|nr:MAG: Stk1 family PASTA domain-containing Ser/Thr kinase [Frankiales bacterium]